MKKTLLFALVLGLAVMFAVPALAFKIESGKDNSFYFGGVALTDIGYWGMEKVVAQRSGYENASGDQTQFVLNIPRHSRLRASVEAGNTGAYWELGLGRDLVAAHQQTDAANAADKTSRSTYVENRKVYGWYKFGNCTLQVGKNDGSFGFVLFPYQNFGVENNNHIVGLGWGVPYDDRNAQVRFMQDVSKAFSWQVALVQPQVTDITVGGKSFDSVQKVPRVDALFTLNFGPVSLYPGASWQQQRYDDLPGSFDDTYYTWLVQLPVRVKAGAFTFAGQIGYGQNLSNIAFQSAFHRVGYTAAGKVKDTTAWFGFADFSFAAGPVTPHFYVGYDKAENTDTYVGDKYNVRMMYGVGINWKISDNFYVVPEFTYYDYGKDPTKAGNPDLGKEWLGGVQFQFVF